MEHVSKVLDRVYTELQAKSDKNKELNHEILSLETAQKLADYEKLKKRIKTMVKKEKLKADLIYECKAEMQNRFDTQTIELDKANKKYEDLQYEIKEERHLIPLTEKLEVVSILNETRDQLKKANNKIEKIKEYCKTNWVSDNPVKFKNDILEIIKGSDNK